jgi:hypothetical protein
VVEYGAQFSAQLLLYDTNRRSPVMSDKTGDNIRGVSRGDAIEKDFSGIFFY